MADNKLVDVRFRVTQEEKDIIKNYANARGETVSDFIRELIRRYEEGIEKESINYSIDKIIKDLEQLKRR